MLMVMATATKKMMIALMTQNNGWIQIKTVFVTMTTPVPIVQTILIRMAMEFVIPKMTVHLMLVTQSIRMAIPVVILKMIARTIQMGG